MKTWEYKYLVVKRGKGKGIFVSQQGINEEDFNELGDQGWELVSILQFNIGGTHLGAIFKREKK
jgi:hypothetical protein